MNLMKANLAVFSIFALLLSACASTTILTENETGLGVEKGGRREFHSSLYYPNGIALHYPGYIIGIQKTDKEIALGRGAVRLPSYLREEVPYFKSEQRVKSNLGTLDVMERLKNEKSLFVAHLTRYETVWAGLPQKDPAGYLVGGYPFIDGELLYNAFLSPALKTNQEQDLSKAIAWKQAPFALSWKDPVSNPQGTLDPRGYYANGVLAFDSLRHSMAADLAKGSYTHVLLFVMGWNTTQQEAIRNYNDIVGNIFTAANEYQAVRDPNQSAGSAFRPLVVGITWPSFWSNNWYNLLSYSTMAHDADELGVSWLNLLVNQVIPGALADAGSRAPFVAIGHSFGGRALTRAAFSAPALVSIPDAAAVSSKAALVVALEGAVSINRFSPDAGIEGGPYRGFGKLADTQIVLTASKWDHAVGGPIFWYDPAGSIKSYGLACENREETGLKGFLCLKALDDSDRKNIATPGGFRICYHDAPEKCQPFGARLAPGKNPRQILYIDASDGITRYNTLDTGGDAHNDIYRLPMGKLLWTLISSYAPSP